VVLDVRKPTEFAEGHVKNAINIPLDEMINPANFSDFEEEQNIYVHCQGGYRSIVASSLLKRQGIHNIRNVVGGYRKISEQKNIKTEKESSVLN
jgi:hydroxyacylglutathione hydrolase